MRKIEDVKNIYFNINNILDCTAIASDNKSLY